MKGFITVTQAMAATQLSRQMLYRLVREGRVQAKRLGWQYFIEQRSLASYCREQGRQLIAQA